MPVLRTVSRRLLSPKRQTNDSADVACTRFANACIARNGYPACIRFGYAYAGWIRSTQTYIAPDCYTNAFFSLFLLSNADRWQKLENSDHQC